MLDVIIGRNTWIVLLSPYGERVAKYAPTRTCIRRYTHTKKEKKYKEKKELKQGSKGRKEGVENNEKKRWEKRERGT